MQVVMGVLKGTQCYNKNLTPNHTQHPNSQISRPIVKTLWHAHYSDLQIPKLCDLTIRDYQTLQAGYISVLEKR